MTVRKLGVTVRRLGATVRKLKVTVRDRDRIPQSIGHPRLGYDLDDGRGAGCRR
jgi:hypothetical protein